MCVCEIIQPPKNTKNKKSLYLSNTLPGTEKQLKVIEQWKVDNAIGMQLLHIISLLYIIITIIITIVIRTMEAIQCVRVKV